MKNKKKAFSNFIKLLHKHFLSLGKLFFSHEVNIFNVDGDKKRFIALFGTLRVKLSQNGCYWKFNLVKSTEKVLI